MALYHLSSATPRIKLNAGVSSNSMSPVDYNQPVLMRSDQVLSIVPRLRKNVSGNEIQGKTAHGK